MLSVSVNSVPLWLIIVAEKSILAVYGNKTTETQSAQRTNEQRRLLPRSKYAIHFKQEDNLDLEFRLLAKNAICNRMNRLL
jgi:hypothetical protein